MATSAMASWSIGEMMVAWNTPGPPVVMGVGTGGGVNGWASCVGIGGWHGNRHCGNCNRMVGCRNGRQDMPNRWCGSGCRNRGTCGRRSWGPSQCVMNDQFIGYGGSACRTTFPIAPFHETQRVVTVGVGAWWVVGVRCVSHGATLPAEKYWAKHRSPWTYLTEFDTLHTR